MTMSAIWLATTYPSAHPDSVFNLATAGWWKSGVKRKRTLAATSAGSRAKAITAMPTVAPPPSSQRSEPLSSTSWRPGARWWETEGTNSSETMMTTLAIAGTHAAAKYRRRALSNAEPSALSP